MDSRYRGATLTQPRIRITFSMPEVLDGLVNRGMLIRKPSGTYFPTSFKPALMYDLPNIVNYIQQVFRGLAQYYLFSDN